MKSCPLFALASLLFAGPAMAVCNVPQPRLVCAEYFSSQVVVEATLVTTRTVPDKDNQEAALGYFYKMRTNKLLRGDIAAQFQIYEGNDSGRSTFEWKPGRKYLLFLFYAADSKSWAVDGCGNSGPLAQAKPVLAQIEAIQAHHDGGGVIHGVVRGTPSELQGLRIVARGANGRYTATPNAEGEFQIKVPPGQYTIHPRRSGLSFHTADFSYENPRNVRIEPGGCAQVQFEASELTPPVPEQKLKQ